MGEWVTKKGAFILCGLFVFVLLFTSIHASQLGMNYYHETMMGKWGSQYIPRTAVQVGQDLDDIKSFTNNVKFYANPFINGNIDWVKSVNSIAKQKGMYTVTVMNTEDRALDDSNWQSYKDKVVAACNILSGKTDEMIVGNEITLHSPYTRTQIRDKVIDFS